MSTHVSTYMDSFHKFRERICVPKAESIFEEYLKAYRGQGYWIPEIENDVDVQSISNFIPEFEKRGFRLKVGPTKEARHIDLNEAPWFRNTLLIFMTETT